MLPTELVLITEFLLKWSTGDTCRTWSVYLSKAALVFVGDSFRYLCHFFFVIYNGIVSLFSPYVFTYSLCIFRLSFPFLKKVVYILVNIYSTKISSNISSILISWPYLRKWIQNAMIHFYLQLHIRVQEKLDKKYTKNIITEINRSTNISLYVW